MKCDELKAKSVTLDGEPNIYKKSDVDAAIAELKQKLHDAEMAKDDAEAANTEYREDIRKLKAENERLKDENARLKNCNVVHIEDFINQSFELRYTKRALWMARALVLSHFDVDKYIYNHTMSKYWKDGDEIFNLACKAMQNKIDKKELRLFFVQPP